MGLFLAIILMCGVHYWDYRYDTGVSEYNNSEKLEKFTSWVENDEILVDEDEIKAWANTHPQPFNRDEYLGQYADTHPIPEEDKTGEIQHLGKVCPDQVGASRQLGCDGGAAQPASLLG